MRIAALDVGKGKERDPLLHPCTGGPANTLAVSRETHFRLLTPELSENNSVLFEVLKAVANYFISKRK